MNLVFRLGRIREYRASDLEPLVRLANDPRIAANLRDVFPHPYTREAGEAWLAIATTQSPANAFVIEVDGEFAGGIGLVQKDDVYRRTAEIGYWLGAPFWGRGIATAAVRALVRHGFENPELERIHAGVFDWNPASARVLEKAGFTLEARHRRAVVKKGRVGDELVYSILRGEALPD